MKEGQRSRTAEGAAAMRAAHLLSDHPVILADPLAIHLTSPTWRVICTSRLLRWLVIKHIYGTLRPVQAQVLARARYAEDQLEKAIATGIRQYVLVGAGLDSFAIRCPDLSGGMRIYELDHPASQESKRGRLIKANIPIPDNLEFVPVDFEKESVAETLKRSSYSPQDRAFFSWLGTVPYLTRDAIFLTLESIASFAAAGGEIVFDYNIPAGLIHPSHRPAMKETRRFTARRGEPLISEFDPNTFPSEVCNLGYDLVENLSPRAQEARYFQGRKDDLRPVSASYFAHFRVRGRS